MITWFARHPTAANLLMLLLLVIGISALPGLKRETFPDFSAQEIEVRVVYPGAAAAEVEEAVCLRLEDAVDSVSDLAELRCEARESLGVLVAKMRAGAPLARFSEDIKTEIEALDTLPDEAEAPVIRELNRADPVISVAVSGPMTGSDLKAYAEDLKTRLQRLPVVSQVEIQGFSDHQLRIEAPAAVLRQYGLSMTDIANAVARQSLDLPAGSLTTREQELLLRYTDERRSPAALAELIVVGEASGAEVRLGDIATISDRFELDEEQILFAGQRAALLAVTKTKAEDTLTVVAAVKAFVAAEQRVAAPGVQFTLTRDVASIVEDRLNLLVTNGWQGLVLVFLTLWLFFHLRFAFWVVMGLPVAFLGGLFVMGLLGYSINMLTMVGLLIALGLMMDDAIVIAENIATRLAQGDSALTAAINGTRDVAAGVLSSFLTTAAVFGPLAFLEGDIGKVLKVIPVVLLIVLAVSLIEAFLILPHHLAHSLARADLTRPGRWRQGFEAGFASVRERGLGRLVDGAIRWRYPFIGAVAALFLVSIGMLAGGHLKFRAFPAIDGDVVEARVLLPQGTPLWRTEAVVAQLTAALHTLDAELTPQQPDGARLVQNVSVQYGKNLDAHETGPQVATLTADLLTAEQRTVQIDELLDRWRTAAGVIPDALSITYKEPQIGPAGLPIDIRLYGDDLERLKAASLDLQSWLGRYGGVVDLTDDLRPGKPELRLRLREGATALGLDAATIANQLRGAFYGITATEIQVGAEAYEVDVRLSAADRDSVDDLADFRITTADGALIPLGEVAVIDNGRGYARIQRINSQRTVTIQGDVSGTANAAQIISDTRARFLPELAARYPDVTVALEGQASETAATGASLRRGFLLGLVGIFIILSFQFRSYIEPVVVMTAIPLALIGVVWGHVLMGLELSMPSMMGFVSLAGIVVNDSILLVEFLKRRAAEGLSVAAAARQASRERFRAVLLTSLTTIAGLLPLLAEKSLQAQVLIPLVTSIVFGLAVTTLLVLLVVPALYSILDDLGLSALARQAQRDSALKNATA